MKNFHNYNPEKFSFLLWTLCLLICSTACAQNKKVETQSGEVKIQTLADGLDHPWGMAFLPDGRLLVTERAGNLRILNKDTTLSEPLKGVPTVFAKGQGGLLDVAVDPDFEHNKFIYLSFAEPGSDNLATTALGRGTLEGDQVSNFSVIFRQKHGIDGDKHFGSRIVFSEDGRIFLVLGERYQFDPAQDLTNHLGTVVRINPDGSIPEDNPFTGDDNAEDAIWSYGHRNIEAAAIDPATGLLWIAEMGPQNGDELNQPKAGKNYGWPLVSWGEHYDGKDIPDPTTRPEFEDAAMQWTPVISPSGMIFYTGNIFSQWKGHMMIGGLSAKGVVIVKVNGQSANEVDRIDIGARTRDVEQAPDGSIFILTDKKNGEILRLGK